MPLARIFTRNPERTAALSSQLQEQGYKVEVAAPDQANLGPADLEIEFEVCERGDVLERAADLAGELGADVAVAPGVLRPAIQPKAEPIAQAAEAVTRAVTELKTQPRLTRDPEPELTRDPEREFEAAFASVIEMPVAQSTSAASVEIPVMEPEPLPPVAFLEEPAVLEPVAMTPIPEKIAVKPAVLPEPVRSTFPEPVRSADPIPYLSQLTPFTSHAPRAEEPRPVYTPPTRQQQPAQKPDRGKKALQDSAKIAAQAWANAMTLASSTTASVRDRFEEYKKRAQVRSAEARAEHAARLLDLEQRRAEAHQRAAELEAARELAAARLIELVRQRGPGLQPEGLTSEHAAQEHLREDSFVEPKIPAQNVYDRRTAAEDRSRQVDPVVAAQVPVVRKPVQAAGKRNGHRQREHPSHQQITHRCPLQPGVIGHHAAGHSR